MSGNVNPSLVADARIARRLTAIIGRLQQRIDAARKQGDYRKADLLEEVKAAIEEE